MNLIAMFRTLLRHSDVDRENMETWVENRLNWIKEINRVREAVIEAPEIEVSGYSYKANLGVGKGSKCLDWSS